MEVILSGFNIDNHIICEIIESFKKIHDLCSRAGKQDTEKDEIFYEISRVSEDLLKKDNLTPETISAAYARISRYPAPVVELRLKALQEVDKARKSNKNIIFGLGHSSVAEHSVFNFDFIGLSRLAVEEIQKFRLCSFTEKSQRYIKVDDEYIIPNEIKESEFLSNFLSLIEKQNNMYKSLYENLNIYFQNRLKDYYSGKELRNYVEGYAKEDARYALSLATTSQMGATINARNLEYMISKLNSNNLREVRKFAQKLYCTVQGVAPSLIKYTDSRQYYSETYWGIKKLAQNFTVKTESNDTVKLLDYTTDGDDRLCSTLLFSVTDTDFKKCEAIVKEMSRAQKIEFVKTALKHIKSYDAVLREFETIDLVFEVILSASAFAQLKRHRMATIISQSYDFQFGFTIPESVKEIGKEKELTNLINESTELFIKMKKKLDDAACYCLTNSHRRRILLKINAREMYHISRLREDESAQWDIRRIAEQMNRQVKKEMPLTFMLLGGKDSFNNIYNEVYL